MTVIENDIGKKPLIILTGPTAVGKTKLSIALAKKIGGEIISADSMQVYRHMDIGSAKVRSDEMEGIPHYLIDCLEPTEDFNIVRFQQLAKDAMKHIWDKGKIPIVVGGTGFYIQGVLYDIDFTENEENHQYRDYLEEIGDEKGNEELHRMLQEVDPKSATAIHANNRKRVIRALEFYEQTGTRISDHNESEREKSSPYEFHYFVLTDNRKQIYENIDRRVDLMIEEGLVSEVKALMEMGCKRDSVAMQGLGYKEIIDYLQGECTLEEAIYLLKRDTRHFAKRQLTWFRRERDVCWIDKEQVGASTDALLEEITKHLET